MIEAFPTKARIYIDTNIFIYSTEDDGSLGETAALILDSFHVSSLLTKAECLHRAIRHEKTEAADLYRAIFAEMILVPIQDQAYDLAAEIGGQMRIKLIDALHVATASLAGCDHFLTNDRGIRTLPGLQVVLLSDFIT